MKKICPKCHRRPADPLLLACEYCRIPFVEDSELANYLSPEQLEQISKGLVKSWPFWGRLSLAFVVAMLISIPTTIKISVHYARQSLSDSLAEFNRAARTQLSAAQQDVTNRIAKEFEDPRIKAMIEAAAQGKAAELLKEAVNPALTNFQLRLEQATVKLEGYSNSLENLGGEIRKAEELASPPTLSLASCKTSEEERALRTELRFSKNKNVPLGGTSFVVLIATNNAVRIERLQVVGISGATELGTQVSEDGKSAAIHFTPFGAAAPGISITVSGPTQALIRGNYLRNALPIDIPCQPANP